jgi:hypothetical protein
VSETRPCGCCSTGCVCMTHAPAFVPPHLCPVHLPTPALAAALDALEAVLTADRERHAYLVGEIERLDPAAGAAMLAALAAAPALPLERIAAILHERGRSLRWPEE